MNRNFLCAALLAGVFVSPVALAAGDAARGRQKALTVCAACHSADGNSQMDMFPRLAGQNADYLAHALKAYQDGRRKNEVMKGMAAALSAQDIEDLAAYFAGQEDGLIVKR